MRSHVTLQGGFSSERLSERPANPASRSDASGRRGMKSRAMARVAPVASLAMARSPTGRLSMSRVFCGSTRSLEDRRNWSSGTLRLARSFAGTSCRRWRQSFGSIFATSDASRFAGSTSTSHGMGANFTSCASPGTDGCSASGGFAVRHSSSARKPGRARGQACNPWPGHSGAAGRFWRLSDRSAWSRIVEYDRARPAPVPADIDGLPLDGAALRWSFMSLTPAPWGPSDP